MALDTTKKGVTVLERALLLGLLWFILTGEMAPGSWVIGAPAALVAALVSAGLVPGSPVSVFSLLRFIPMFLMLSVSAAFDVAWRAFVPRPPIAPAQVDYAMSLPDGLARVVFMNTVSLLPGTLSAAQDNDRLSVHVLDHRHDHVAELARLERNIACIFPAVTCD